MKKPVEAIERIRGFISLSCAWKGQESFDDVRAIIAFLDSLPSESEIVPEGHVCVKWPDGLTKERLMGLAAEHDSCHKEDALYRLAAIAPERKNPTKRRISVLQFQGHGETYGKLELSFNMAPQFPWVKVGECEIEE